LKEVKVFGIGFHKTGTTSLAKALRLLGYKVCGPFGVQDPDIRRNILSGALERANTHDAFQDNPWPLVFREMDRHFPGSKFILTMRTTDEWIRSVVSHFRKKPTEMRKFIYGELTGAPAGNEARYREVYDRHNEDVLAYFSERPGDLLVFRITEGEGWERLCPFLGIETLSNPFPKLKERATREKRNSAALPPRLPRAG
jgi:hypothetical protein